MYLTEVSFLFCDESQIIDLFFSL